MTECIIFFSSENIRSAVAILQTNETLENSALFVQTR